MRRTVARLIMIACTVGLLAFAAGRATAAPFTDKNLEGAVRAVLQDTKAELTDKLLENVYVLDASGKSIASLAGRQSTLRSGRSGVGVRDPFKTRDAGRS